MIPLKLIYSAAKGQFAQALVQMEKPIASATTGAIKDTAQYIKASGRAAIRSGGFGVKWQNALRVEVYPKRGDAIDPALFVHHRIPYASVFETGAKISGNPLLWIPLPGISLKFGGRRLTPRLFVEKVGPLHSVNVPGKPPMLAAYMAASADPNKISVRKLKTGATRIIERGSSSVISVPIFYGISQVQITSKFHLRDVYRRAKENISTYYVQHIRSGK